METRSVEPLATRDAVAHRLRELGHEAHFVEVKGDGRKSEDAAAGTGIPIEAITKCLVFGGKQGELVAAIAMAPDRVDVRTIEAAAASSRLSFLAPAQLTLRTGFLPGGVPIVLLGAFDRVIIDEHVLEHEFVWASGGTAQLGVRVPKAALQSLGYIVAKITKI